MRRARTFRAPWRNFKATTSLAATALLLGALAPSAALAHEPKKANEPRIMSEPGEITNVVDAFDDDNNNNFDLHLTLGYQRSSLNAKILRETFIGGNNNPGLSTGRYTSSLMNVANYSEVTSRLNTRADISVYKDIGLYLRMPLILGNDRELTGLNGSDQVQGTVLQGAPVNGPASNGGREQLFSLPFKSPTRSGIEYLAAGFELGIFNQARDPSKPTWIFGAEGRFTVSDPMHACGSKVGLNQAGTQVDCADPSDINRNGVGSEKNGFAADDRPGGGTLEGNFSGARKPGVSRGTTAIEIHSIMSRRVKYVEPYGGFRALFEFANKDSDFGATRDLSAVLTSSPPLQGWMIAGMLFIPYENREQFQRLTFDLRFTGTYRSQGRDYTPLYDAIGSSDAVSIRRPNYAEYRSGDTGSKTITNPDGTTSTVPDGTQSVVNPASSKIYVTGLTDTAAYGSFTIGGSAQFQAGEYVKFQLGSSYTYIQSHTITGDQPCNPNFKNDTGKAGPCQSLGTTRSATGIPNPLYRPAIDIVGRRFLMSSAGQLDLWAQAVVMF